MTDAEKIEYVYIVFHPSFNNFSHFPIAFLDESLANEYCDKWNGQNAGSIGFAQITYAFPIIRSLNE